MAEIINHLVNNECYKVNQRRAESRGVLIHDTATPGGTIENFIKSWNVLRPNGRQVCVHAFSDDKKVVNTLPYEMRCWGCGSGQSGSGNNLYIQIEMCVPKDIYFENGWEYKTRSKEVTDKYILDMVELTAEWAANRLYELGIKVVTKLNVTSHYEACGMGLASNHSDPKGLLSMVGLNMDRFRDKVSGYLLSLNGKVENIESDSVIKSGDRVKLVSEATQFNGKPIKDSYKTKEYIVKQVDSSGRVVLTINDVVVYAVDVNSLISLEVKEEVKKENNHLIRVTATALNIRSGPGTSYGINGVIKDKGVYTIVLRDGEWGKLKSGLGWINMLYTKEV